MSGACPDVRRPVPARLHMLRGLRRWSARFSGRFPARKELEQNPRYWNEKIPVCSSLVEGPHTTPALQRECAQILIDACARLMRAKPRQRSDIRVTCCIALPDMFSSEVCLYLDEDYFQGHTRPRVNAYGRLSALDGRSLAREWGLSLPAGMHELGVHVDYPRTDTHEGLLVDRWFFGEVAG